MTPPVWSFDQPPRAARAPHVMLAAFSRGPLRDDVPLSLSRFGAPDAAAIAALDVRAIPRAADPGWFDGWRAGSLRAIAEGDLGAALADLDAADHVQLIMAAPVPPADLGYLQAAWAVARHAVARGATTVLDVHAHRFLAGDAVPVPGALDVAAEVRVVFESEAARDDRAHALHTRGLRKFGAPDLVALCGQADAALVGEVVRQLADKVARGTDLELPRHAVALDDATTWYVVADEHGLADLLHLNNAARVLVDGAGHDLVGVRGQAN